jgi:hypothetical protein
MSRYGWARSRARAAAAKEPDLFDPAYLGARRTDPQTSHDAKASVEVVLARNETLIVGAVRDRGTAILDEIIAATGIQKVSVSPTLRPLERKGILVRTGQTRPGESGRQQTEWRLATT